MRGLRREWLFAVVAAMIIAGGFVLTSFQTQHLFRDSAIAFEEGRIPRNDGAIAVSAILLGAGGAFFLALGARVRLRERLVPSALAGTAATLLIVLHLTIFVNYATVPAAGTATFSASFLFHGTALEPIAFFLFTLVSVLLIAVLVRSVWTLYGASSYGRHFGPRASPQAQRNRVLAAGFLLLATLGFFAVTFLAMALRLEAGQEATRSEPNLLLIYYLLVLGLALLSLVITGKSALLVWRHRWFPDLAQPRRLLSSLSTAEWWLAGLVVALDLAAMALAPAANQVDRSEVRGDLVFAFTDRGLAFLFLFTALPYGVYVTSAWRAQRTLDIPVLAMERKWDTNVRYLAWSVLGAAALGTLGPAVGMPTLPRFIMVTAYLAVVTGVRAFHVRLVEGTPAVALRQEAGPFAFAFFALAWVTALMLWGLGNTVEAEYAQQGSAVVLTNAELQAYAVAYRFLGSLSLALPAVLGLDAATRWNSPRKLGPLVVVLFGLVAGAHMLFPIAYEEAFDPRLQTTDVLVGFAWAGQEQVTKAAIAVAWPVLALVTMLSAMRILTAGRAPPPSGPTRI